MISSSRRRGLASPDSTPAPGTSVLILYFPAHRFNETDAKDFANNCRSLYFWKATTQPLPPRTYRGGNNLTDAVIQVIMRVVNDEVGDHRANLIFIRLVCHAGGHDGKLVLKET